MSQNQFIDATGDTYSVIISSHGTMLTLACHNGTGGGTDLLIFSTEDAAQIAAMILDAAKEATKQPEDKPVRQPEQPMWHGDREYLQAQHERAWTPERYGGGKG